MYFGKNLKYLMKSRKISGESLSDILNLSQSAISSYTTGGAFPKVETLFKLKEIFKIDLDELFFKDLTIELKKPTESVKEPTTIYGNDLKITVHEPSITEGVGIIENIIIRLENVEKQIQILNQKNDEQ